MRPIILDGPTTARNLLILKCMLYVHFVFNAHPLMYFCVVTCIVRNSYFPWNIDCGFYDKVRFMVWTVKCDGNDKYKKRMWKIQSKDCWRLGSKLLFFEAV